MRFCVCMCFLRQPICCGWSQTNFSVLSQIKMQTWRVQWVERNRKTYTTFTVFRTMASSRWTVSKIYEHYKAPNYEGAHPLGLVSDCLI